MTTNRRITDHEDNLLNDQIEITVCDGIGYGGAHHCYEMKYAGQSVYIFFQKGGIAKAGVNGISNEALIAIVIDRLRCFQAGRFACRENALALTKLEEAMMWLHSRTRERVLRGVEGKEIL